MIGSIKWLAPIMAIAIPVAAFAQGDDVAYCKALSAKYESFVNDRRGHANDRGSLDGQVAVQQCMQGNSSSAIPVLERELINNKIDLPKRG
jgi:hypothetical protein